MKKLILLFLLLQTIGVFGQKKLKTENVFLITVDGLRWEEVFTGADPKLVENKDYVKHPEELKKQFWRETAQERREVLMPFFWNTIAKEGQLHGNRLKGSKVNCTNEMLFSYPGYNEILAGFADDKNITSNDKNNNKNTTVLEFVNQQEGFENKVSAFGSWDVFPYIINQERSGIYVNAGFRKAKGENLTAKEKFLNEIQDEIPSPWHSVRLDAFTHNFAVEELKKKHPKLLYISYGETDDFAHDGNYQEYLRSTKRTDEFIKKLWDFVQNDPVYKDKTSFVIITDHGRGHYPLDLWKSHGKTAKRSDGKIYEIKGSDQIWMAVLGPDTPAKGETSNVQLYQNQVAQTTAKLLGLDFSKVDERIGKAVSESIKQRNK